MCSCCFVCSEKDILCTLVHSVPSLLPIKLKALHNVVNRCSIWMIAAFSEYIFLFRFTQIVKYFRWLSPFQDILSRRINVMWWIYLTSGCLQQAELHTDFSGPGAFMSNICNKRDWSTNIKVRREKYRKWDQVVFFSIGSIVLSCPYAFLWKAKRMPANSSLKPVEVLNLW